MRYSRECRVDSKIRISNILNVVEKTKEYIFAPNEDGFLASIRIITDVANPEKFYSEIEKGHEKTDWKITIKSDENIVNDLRSDFQYLESTLAFIGNLKRVYWEDATQEWIPETEQEKSKLKMFAAQFRRIPSDRPTMLTKELFGQIVRDKTKYDCLTTLKSFYREGKNLYDQFQYVNAFSNFYFIIEDLYGEGKTKNKQIEESYRSSEELKKTIEWWMNNHIKTSEKHSKDISQFLRELNLQNNTEDIIRLLIRLRGRVHHYTSKSSLRQATPLTQRGFESVAFLTMGIAMSSILKETARINRKHKQNAK